MIFEIIRTGNKDTENDIIEATEKYYRNEIVINEYLNNNKPIYKAQGTFSGKINGMDTSVEWENVIKLHIEENPTEA